MAGEHLRRCVIDFLPQVLLREDAVTALQSMGEWLSAYQRVTHYLRALDVWQPPPHILALAILERAFSKAEPDHALSPLRLAMNEVHGFLSRQGSVSGDDAGAIPDWQGSACRRVAAWIGNGKERDLLGDAGKGFLLRPVPVDAPGPMVPQSLEASPLTGAARALTARILQLLGVGWRRRHA